MTIKFSDIFSSVDDKRIEEVFNKTRDVAEVVGKKSAERIELSRKKVEYQAGISIRYSVFANFSRSRVTAQEKHLSLQARSFWTESFDKSLSERKMR